MANVYIANVYGKGAPDNGHFRLIQQVSFEMLNSVFSGLNPDYSLAFCDRDHSGVNRFVGGVHTKILYHMQTNGGRIVRSPHTNQVISGNRELSDHIFEIQVG